METITKIYDTFNLGIMEWYVSHPVITAVSYAGMAAVGAFIVGIGVLSVVKQWRKLKSKF